MSALKEERIANIVAEGIGGLDRQSAALGHRIPRIDREIDNSVFELAAVARDRPQVFWERR
jgi:hypothetical protein